MDCFVAKNVNAPSNDGFTLAEVLITLVIIGVIAAITVPTLITKYQKEQTVTRLKKAYSTLAQTTARAIADNGPIKTWETGENYIGSSATNFNNKYLLPYLNISRNCNLETTDTCKFSWTYLNNELSGELDNTYARFYLSDGTFIATSVSYDGNLDENDKLVLVLVDINGQKKPNKFGRDIFRLTYFINYNAKPSRNGKFMPTCPDCARTTLLSTAGNACTKDKSGGDCLRLIQLDGWRIADDYPW